MANYGFFNSNANNPIKYDADDFNKIFSGVIHDGIFAEVGKCFEQEIVGKNIVVKPGKCWFKNKWFENVNNFVIEPDGSKDALLSYPRPDMTFPKYFGVVIEVNNNDKTIGFQCIEGVASENPERPMPTINENTQQMVIGYYLIKKDDNTFTIEKDTMPVIGTDLAPYVTSILEVPKLNDLYAHWQKEWDEFYVKKTGYDDIDEETGEKIHHNGEFDDWFEKVKDDLDEKTKTNFERRISDLEMAVFNMTRAEEIQY